MIDQPVVARRRFLQVCFGAAGAMAAGLALAACGGASAPPPSSGAPAAAKAPSSAPAVAASAAGGNGSWQQTWNQWLAAAKQEQTVVVLGPPTPKLRETIPPAVKSKLGLTVQYTGQASGDFAAKLANERAAGTYTADVVVAGANSMFDVLAGHGKVTNGVMGMLAPLKPQLLLPEVLDTSKYQQNKLWFVDPEGQYVLRISNFVSSSISINTSVVKPGDVKAWHDLLSPAYKGKIVMYDPTIAGAAISPSTQLWNAFGQDFVKQLYVDQQPFISRDHRQIADMLAKGSHPVALFLQEQALRDAAAQGLPLTAVASMSDLPTQVTGGFGYVGLMDHAPHPNAAKVFINWMLSPEGQQLWQDAQLQASTRTDLDASKYPDWFKDSEPKPGEKYFDGQSWDFVETDTPKVQKALREMLGRH